MANYGRKHYRVVEREERGKEEETGLRKAEMLVETIRVVFNAISLGLLVAALIMRFVDKKSAEDDEE